MLTKAFLTSDPPLETEMSVLFKHIDRLLDEKCPLFQAEGPVIGTGGTVAALYALNKGMSLGAIVPEAINGRVLAFSEITSCLEKIRRLSTAQRIEDLNIDLGRAQVLVAGAAVVSKLLRHVNASELLVSMSDLLEGVLMELPEGEQHG
jgi:exopolyphosphatase/guanosine-5'-triphosphate,3'-diphosphate pyrophosphatase